MGQHFCFLLLDGFSHLSFSCAVEPLRLANRASGEELFTFTLASESGNSATCLNGFKLAVDTDFANLPKCDRLFVLASYDMKAGLTPALKAALRHERSRGTNLGGLCSGAWILAELGFLDEMRVALHWEFHASFRETFPDTEVARSVFVSNEKVLTAAGGTANVDLMLTLIGREYGKELAISVADQMVHNTIRDETVDQRVSFQARVGVRNAHLANAVEIMRNSLEEPTSTSDIARQIGISTRQLERLFRKYLQVTPKRYHTELRLDRARQLLLQTEQSITEIAVASGFESGGHFCKVYRKRYGATPSHQRTNVV